MNRINANEPLKNLSDENDFLGLKDKSEQITSFIDSYYSLFKSNDAEKISPKIENPMMVLYGNWGSGKTSIMYDIKDKLLGKNFKVVFFDAWKFEKDGNLALSLFDVISEKLSSELNYKVLYKITRFLKKLPKIKSISAGVKVKDPLDMIGYQAGGKLEFNEAEKSFYKELKEIESLFKKFEEALLEYPQQKLIIFIDDLDRCEPENVLSLLSAIKLFFTYTERTLYFCGIDKKAVENSVKIKYKNVIKSEEYLEKIFDISFNMPRKLDIDKIVNYYFEGDFNGGVGGEIKLIVNFFKAIEFTNARHLKKLLNKYRILKYTKSEGLFGADLIPELDNVINVVFVLYFMVLYDFYPKEFDRLEDYEGRKKVLNDNLILNGGSSHSSIKKQLLGNSNSIDSILGYLSSEELNGTQGKFETPPFINLLFLFSTIKDNSATTIKVLEKFNGNQIIDFYKAQNKSILNKFALFLSDNTKDNGYLSLKVPAPSSKSRYGEPYDIKNTTLGKYLGENKHNYTLKNLFDMAKKVL